MRRMMSKVAHQISISVHCNRAGLVIDYKSGNLHLLAHLCKEFWIVLLTAN